MKFTLATIAILAAAVSAQSIAELQASIPSCAQTCLATAITGVGCSLTDTACSCGSKMGDITKAATPCVITGCSSADALKTQSITGQICAAAPAAGASSAASSAPASAASSAASSAVASVSSQASSAIASVSSKASSAVSMATSKASSAVSMASSAAAGGAASPTSSGPVQATNAAGKKEVGSLMAGAALIAALAL